MTVMEQIKTHWWEAAYPQWMVVPVAECTEEKPTTVVDLPPMEVQSLTDQMTAAIIDVVREAGSNYIYRVKTLNGYSGMYVHNGKPDCIAGRVLHRLGVPLATLSEFEGGGADHVITALFGGKYPRDDVEQAARKLRIAQAHNDMAVPWGNVLMQFQATE